MATVLVVCPASAGTAHPARVTAAPGQAQPMRSVVVLRSFTARKSGPRTVTLRWRTGAERELLGFNVYRRQGSESRMRLIERLIPSQNSPDGASYAYGDWLPKTSGQARYWLQAVKANGSRVWLGSAAAR